MVFRTPPRATGKEAIKKKKKKNLCSVWQEYQKKADEEETPGSLKDSLSAGSGFRVRARRTQEFGIRLGRV